MRRDSRERKEAWRDAEPGRHAFILVNDARDTFQGGAHADKFSGNHLYIAERLGAVSLNSMTPVKSRRTRAFIVARWVLQMSYDANFDDPQKSGGQLASGKGWTDFTRWLIQLPAPLPALRHLCEYGWSDQLPALQTDLQDAASPDRSIRRSRPRARISPNAGQRYQEWGCHTRRQQLISFPSHGKRCFVPAAISAMLAAWPLPRYRRHPL